MIYFIIGFICLAVAFLSMYFGVKDVAYLMGYVIIANIYFAVGMKD